MKTNIYFSERSQQIRLLPPKPEEKKYWSLIGYEIEEEKAIGFAVSLDKEMFPNNYLNTASVKVRLNCFLEA